MQGTPLAVGIELGSFHITALLGKGGMGEVYRARDSKLKREVAIKILPDEFSRDHERVTRFRREAEVLASLNHPHIAAIYDLQESRGSRFLVLELVEGETLAERIARGPVPVDEALGIAKQICEALEAAHEKGVVHRDLKPANIKITPDGKVKVLDFGLAKAFQEQQETDLSNSPTLMSAASVPGVILGTAAYMSPEQARGRKVDKRTDIFAFGCVSYEMLTAKRAFDGEDVSEILAHVLTSEPDWNLLSAEVPLSIRKLLQLCLEKNPRNRRQDARDVLIDIEQSLKGPADAANPSAVPARTPRLAWIAMAALALALVFLAAFHFTQKPLVAPEMRLEINTPSTAAPLEFALSPDGRYIVFVASGDGPQRLWLRALDKTGGQPIVGTEGADYPFWSPDSRSIGFSAAGKLKRVDLGGGPPQTLTNALVFRGGTWNADGTILFAPATNSPLFRIAASGGEPVAVTKLDMPTQTRHRFPQFLPDGHHFLFHANSSPETSGIYLGSLDGGDPKRLTAADTAGAYLSPDTVLFIRQTTLMAQHLDLKRGELTGDPVTVADPVGSTNLIGGFSVSADGRLAYRSGGAGTHQLSWYDRTGKAAGVAGEPGNNLLHPELSPDGKRVAVTRTIENNIDVWLMDLVRGGITRFTTDPAPDNVAIWSPDGTRIAFSSNRKGKYNLYVKPASGVGAEEVLLETPNNKDPLDWSKDGRFLLYWESDPKTAYDLWALPVTGSDRKPIAIVNTPFDERNGQFSPDGRWVAYETNESGRFEIEVQPFPNPSGKWPVSTNGGVQPRWRADGKELYFIAPDGKLMAAAISASGAAFAAATPVALFPTRLASNAPTYKQQYAVSRDGRFLLNQETESSGNTPITLILNWHPKMEK